ncbi:MAG: ABC transporter permease subunit [Chloroflexi bacterium]|nr:ABC transporter permease subunit [Chloroflexota bacterium]
MIRTTRASGGPGKASGWRLAQHLARISFVRASALLVVALVVLSWLYIATEDRGQGAAFFSVEAAGRAWDFLWGDLLGAGSDGRPAFLKASEWRAMVPLARDTLAMSVLGIGFAGLVALATFVFGARNVMTGELAPYGGVGWKLAFLVARGFFIVARGVPELIWAFLIIFIFSPGILPGAIALAIHNSGILGKLASETVEGLDPRPIRSLQGAGAGQFQVLFYGVLPQALPKLLTFLLYRWEVIIRTTIVVGFVAAGGLGQEFRLSMSHFQYTTVTLILIWYLGLVVFVDLVAVGLRRLAR